MMEAAREEQICVVIGASHAGVNFAFTLRKSGWAGKIMLFDMDPHLPYHRPPLSKAFLTQSDGIEKYALRPASGYEKENISLRLGEEVVAIDREKKVIKLADETEQGYDKLVLATGARPFIPPIKGLAEAANVFPLRTAADVMQIQEAVEAHESPRVLIIGGGYIGLETAASLRKFNAAVKVLEREDRLLARVTDPLLSGFLKEFHEEKGVEIYVDEQAVEVRQIDSGLSIICGGGETFEADVVIVGCGIRLNTELATAAGLDIENGIKVSTSCQTSDPDIYAIGDCTSHYNAHYDRHVRLESVQNAADQAKVAANAIAGKEASYDKIPWFWSDQFDLKIQMVGLNTGYDEVVLRREPEVPNKFSLWYFRGEELLAVDAVNHTKAYVLGTKFLKGRNMIDKSRLADQATDLKPGSLLRVSNNV